MSSKSINQKITEWALSQSETCKRDILSGKVAIMPIDPNTRTHYEKPTKTISRNLAFRVDKPAKGLAVLLVALGLTGCATCNEAAMNNADIVRETKICTDAGLNVRHEVMPFCGDAIKRVQCDFPVRTP